MATTEAKIFNCTNCNDAGAASEMFIYNNELLCRKCIKAHTPYPFCHDPTKCLQRGICTADPNCCE